MDIFTRLQSLVLAQGIVSRKEILPTTDLVLDLHYHALDIAEYIWMVENEFKISIPEEQYPLLTRLEGFIQYISSNTIKD
jgi:acyl carrier protein